MSIGKKLKLLYMGTPDFAAVSLQYLIEQGYQITGVVCRADKPRGRGMQVQAPPVKLAAEAAGLPVYQPETLKNGAFQPVLQETVPDLIVVVAYGKILPADVLTYPKLGCINLHGSLLPKYRGALRLRLSERACITSRFPETEASIPAAARHSRVRLQAGCGPVKIRRLPLRSSARHFSNQRRATGESRKHLGISGIIRFFQDIITGIII